MKTLLASLALSLAAWSAALCGGSLSTEEALQPLKAAPVLWKYVDETLNLSDTAWGTRCGHHWGFLGGQRIGPYSITATSKSDPSLRLWLTITCEQHFFDAQGKELPLENGEITDAIIERACKVEEKAISITITPDSPSAEDNQTQKVVHPQPAPNPATR